MSKNAPEIRFKGFEGEWEETTLSQLASSFEYGLNAAATTYDGKNKYIRITDIDDFTHAFKYDDLTSPNANFEDIQKYKLTKNDLLFARTGASVGKTYLYREKDGDVFFAGFLIRAKINSESLSEFVFQNTQTYSYNKYIRITSQRSGQPGVSAPEYMAYSLNIPLKKDEQSKIGSYFDQLDALIEGKQKKLEMLKNLKRAYLDKMFPKKGAKVPEVRFKGFSSDWEEKSFSTITFKAGEKNKENKPLESYSISNEKGFVPQNEQFENGGTMRDADKSMYIIVPPNSFAYNPARINIGSIGYQNIGHDVIVSSLYEVFQTSEECDDAFLWHWFKTPHFSKMVEAFQEGGVRLYFYYDKLCMGKILLPTVPEQRKIAQFFTHLDNLITLQQQELEKLKNIKSACLQKMFV